MIATDADVIISGEQINDGFGASVASAGDVNGDGGEDIIVGADQLFNEGTGKAYAFYGPLAGSIQAANANAILIGEIAQGLFGVSVLELVISTEVVSMTSSSALGITAWGLSIRACLHVFWAAHRNDLSG